MNTYNVKIGQVTNNGIVCQNPVVTLVGHGEALVNCLDEVNGVYQVQTLDDLSGATLEFLVQCSECDVCPPRLITKTFCDSNLDCQDCQTCSEAGFCESICDPDQFCENDKCVDCLTGEDCPNNQVCLNGKCTCPDGSDPDANGRCIECAIDSDCETCEVCQDGTCLPKDCHDGVCDPTSGECIDCLNSGDCGPNEVCDNGECTCADGFVEVNGVCVSVECQLDSDCPTCFQCSNNSCIPISCPFGKVPVIVNGVCECVPECDPDNPECEDGNFCTPSTIDGLFGCVPCTGDCTNGCDYPCVCSASKDMCIDNPCSNTPCVDGSECGDGCGCLGGTCVLCDSISCPSTECNDIIGCECQGSACKDADTVDNCNFASCEISSDCGLGCTCQGGRCVSCDNYSCQAGTCEEKDGCKCVGRNCIGDDISDCQDILSLDKDDANCRLIGQLTKNEACSCPEVTIALVPKTATSIIGDTLVLSFDAQLRKGEANSSDLLANPLMSDTTHPDIADNDTADAGAIEMGFRNRYDNYAVTYDGNGNEIRNFVGSSLGSRTAVTSTYSGSASTTLNGQLPKVGSEIREGAIVKVVTEVIVDFNLSSSIDFPNQCSYAPGTSLGTYTITADGDIASLTPKGKGVRSDSTRYPLFKWYKSDSNSFGSTPFRKKYIPGAGGVHIDILSDFDADGLEPCKTYLLESDCTCDDSKSKFVTFCNPTTIPYTLSDCNHKITLGDTFSPCQVNLSAGVQYGFTAGSVNETFSAGSFPANQEYTSTTQISSVEFYQLCGTDKQCSNVTNQNVPSAEAGFITSCNGDGTFDIEFVSLSTCNVTKVVISDGTQLVTNFSTTLDIGSYTAMVYTDCNCPAFELSFTENCCEEIVVPNCYRECDGTLVGCAEAADVTYTDQSGNPISSLADYISAASVSDATTVLITRPGCDSKQLNIPSITQNCCSDYRFVWTSNDSGTGGTVQVYGGFNVGVTVTAQSSGSGTPAVANAGGGIFNITGLVDGKGYDIVVNDVTCGQITDTITTGNCSAFMLTAIDADPCNFAATVPPTACQCTDIAVTANVTNVVVTASEFTVTYSASVVSSASPTAATFTDNYGNTVNDFPTATNTVVIPRSDGLGGFSDTKPFVITASGISLEDNCSYGSVALSFTISSNGSAIPVGSVSETAASLDPLAKHTFFEWDRSGLKFSEYQAETSTITDATMVGGVQFVKQGQAYSVTATCGECTDTDSATYCCPPVITTAASQCNKQVVVTVTGAPGEYNIVYGESGGQVTITDRAVPVSLAFSSLTPLSATSATVTSATTPSCTFSQSVTLQTECEPALTPSACVGDKYDLTLSGCSGATYTITPSGGTYDAVNGNVVEGIVKNSGIQINVVDDLTSCTFDYVENVDWTDPCIVACDAKAWTSSPINYIEGTCVTTTYQDDGSFEQGVIDTSATVDKVGVSTALAEGAVVGDYDGPNYATAGAYTNTLNNTIVGSLVNGPNDYVVRFYQGSDDCFTAFVVNVPETDCTCQLSYTLTGNQATCSNIVELNDGSIELSGYTNVTHFGISSEGALTYDGPTTVATATAVSTDPEDLVIGIPNTNGGQTSYIIRLFGTTDVCFEDTEVIVLDQSCECDGPSESTTGTFTAGTCDSGTGLPNDDGKLIWKLVPGQATPNADRYHIAVGPTFSGGLTYATATVLPASTGTQPAGFEYILKSDVPTAGETYTFRIYDGDNSCFVDKTVTVPGTVCSFDCTTLCDGKNDGDQCNGAGTECQSGNCVATAACTADECTYTAFDSQGCVICANSDSGTPCTDGECDGSGNCVVFTGGCCNGASCTETTESACTGTWLGVNSNCTSNEVAVSGISIGISPDFGLDCTTDINISANIACSGCSCSDISGTYLIELDPISGGSNITLSSGNIAALVDTSEDCNSTGLVLDSRNADAYAAGAVAGDVIRVTYTFANPSGCTYIGTGGYNASYTITASDITNWVGCQPPPEGICCSGSTCLGFTTEAGCAGSWSEGGPGCTTGTYYCCNQGTGQCSGPNSYNINCGSPSCQSGWSVVDNCSQCDVDGACCAPDGSCTVTAPSFCSGDFQGSGTDCVSANCQPQAVPGVCCNTGGCQPNSTSLTCTGTFFAGATGSCAPCLGACCQSGGGCVDTYNSTCVTIGGSFQGFGSNCAGVSCPTGGGGNTGACCFSGGSCLDGQTAAGCTGIYQGDGTLCSNIECPT